MNTEKLQLLINKIYNEGLFTDEIQNEEMKELNNMTSYPNVNELFYSDLAPKYVFDTIMLYEKMKKEDFNDEKYISMIKDMIYNLDNIKDYELDLYCMIIGDELSINKNEVFDRIFELSEENSPKEIFYKLKN